MHRYLKNEIEIVAGLQWIDCGDFTPTDLRLAPVKTCNVSYTIGGKLGGVIMVVGLHK